MWSDAQADPPVCSGSGAPALPATRLADGFPEGRALCAVCTGFVPLVAGALARHDAFRDPTDGAEAARRAEWFNTVGWN